MIQSLYLHNVLTSKGLTDARRRVNRLVREKIGTKNFDAIAFRGVSGALVAPLVCVSLRKPPIVIRKPNEGSHSRARIEGITGRCIRYIIVDDFISTGNTVNDIMTVMSEHRADSKCVGVVLWQMQLDSVIALAKVTGLWEPVRSGRVKKSDVPVHQEKGEQSSV